MSRYNQHQEKLRHLGAEARQLRDGMDTASGDDRKALSAQYARAINKIDRVVDQVREDYPDKCWRDEDPKYKALSALWRDARRSQK